MFCNTGTIFPFFDLKNGFIVTFFRLAGAKMLKRAQKCRISKSKGVMGEKVRKIAKI